VRPAARRRGPTAGPLRGRELARADDPDRDALVAEGAQRAARIPGLDDRTAAAAVVVVALAVTPTTDIEYNFAPVGLLSTLNWKVTMPWASTAGSAEKSNDVARFSLGLPRRLTVAVLVPIAGPLKPPERAINWIV
jgi:hypothetical protein